MTKNTKNIIYVVAIIVFCVLLLVMTAICTHSCDTDYMLDQLNMMNIDPSQNINQEPQYTYEITSVEREMLARLVYREANTESIECQEAVVSVVINRWKDGRWGDTLEDVVYAENQFAPANLLYCTTPTETNYEAVDYVIKNGVTIDEYVMYFRANYHFQWNGYEAYQKIDSTCFGYMAKDKQ